MLIAGRDGFETITKQACRLVRIGERGKVLVGFEAPMPTVGANELIGRDDGMKVRRQIARRDSFRKALDRDDVNQFADAISRPVFDDDAGRSFRNSAVREGEPEAPVFYALLTGEFFPVSRHDFHGKGRPAPVPRDVDHRAMGPEAAALVLHD